MSSPICGPPPCTTTGRMPTARISTMSSAKRRQRASASVMALPPYFTTTVRAAEAPDVGQGLDQHRRSWPTAPACAPWRSSRRPHVLVDVGVGEVVGEDEGPAGAEPEVGDDRRGGGRPCGRPPRPASWSIVDTAGGHRDAAVGDRHQRAASKAMPALPELAGDAAPVGVLAVPRALDQLALGDRAGRRSALRRRMAAPTTSSRTTLVAPSASPTICAARPTHASATAARQVASSAPARPRRWPAGCTVSLVDVQPSDVEDVEASRPRRRASSAPAARPARRRRRW